MRRPPSLGELDRGMSGRIYPCTSPTDMRKGFDAPAARVKDFLGQDPLWGRLFPFVGRGKNRLKVLYWDADGFALWYNRLENHTHFPALPCPPMHREANVGGRSFPSLYQPCQAGCPRAPKVHRSRRVDT